MSDQKRARAEARAAQKRDRAKVFTELGVTRSDHALFTALYYGIRIPPARLPKAAAMEDSAVSDEPATEEECRASLNACLAKGWLQVIEIQRFASGVKLETTPRLKEIQADELPDGIDEAREFLETLLPRSQVVLDPGGGAQPEGVVVRAPDRGVVAKLRFKDYQELCRSKKKR